ncbi:hypothetical protein NQZ79_g357 [Umbelopsis isabellina]|nr:hypothetical protein NQZ79_g357 [Umbelopsis isabellina]
MTRSKQNLYPLPPEESRHYQRNGMRDARSPTKKSGRGRGNWGDIKSAELDPSLEMEIDSHEEDEIPEVHATSMDTKVQLVDAEHFVERKGFENENESMIEQ